MSGAVVVAIDGPAGSGKSSVSRAAATALGYDYLDTGAAYRALGWWVLDSGIGLDQGDRIVAALPEWRYCTSVRPDDVWVRVGDTDVTRVIREPRISVAASAVAKIPAVRSLLVDLFRRIIRSSTRPGIVVEGRDITTVVAPDAAVRLLLTADEHVRAARRAEELDAVGDPALRAALRARDASDSTVANFTTAADGVVTLDSTDLTFDETVAAVVDLVRRTIAS